MAVVLSDLKRINGEDLASKIKALSAQLFKKADQDKVTTQFSQHDSRLDDLEHRLKDLKDAQGQPSGGAFDSGIDEIQQKLMAEMNQKLQQLIKQVEKNTGNISSNKKEIESLKKQLLGVRNSNMMGGGAPERTSSHGEGGEKLEDLAERLLTLENEFKKLQN